MKKISQKCAFLLAGLAVSFTCAAGPQLISVAPDRPGTLLVTVDWGKMASDPQRGEFRLPCAGGNCKQQDVGLLANINGEDEFFPPVTSKLQSTVASEADALQRLIAGNRKSGVWRYRVPVPVTSDLCFKYTLGSAFEVHAFHQPACIAQALLTPGKNQP